MQLAKTVVFGKLSFERNDPVARPIESYIAAAVKKLIKICWKSKTSFLNMALIYL